MFLLSNRAITLTLTLFASLCHTHAHAHAHKKPAINQIISAHDCKVSTHSFVFVFVFVLSNRSCCGCDMTRRNTTLDEYRHIASNRFCHLSPLTSACFLHASLYVAVLLATEEQGKEEERLPTTSRKCLHFPTTTTTSEMKKKSVKTSIAVEKQNKTTTTTQLNSLFENICFCNYL